MTCWGDPGVVSGFASGAPNASLVQLARAEAERRPVRLRVLDIGCGAGRNAGPLAALGAAVVGVDLARPMLVAASGRAEASRAAVFVAAPMDRLPVADGSVDLVVAHGIWNLARSSVELRAALDEAARVARPGAALFVYTFSRAGLPRGATPLPGETFVLAAGGRETQCFLTDEELTAELAEAGFEKEKLEEHGRPRPGALMLGGPVFLEGTFRRTAVDGRRERQSSEKNDVGTGRPAVPT